MSKAFLSGRSKSLRTGGRAVLRKSRLLTNEGILKTLCLKVEELLVWNCSNCQAMV